LAHAAAADVRCAGGRWVYDRRFVLFCTRFVYRISCRDPRPPRHRPSRPNTKRPTVGRSQIRLCVLIQQPAAASQQRLPRSAAATPTAVTPQRPTVERQTTVVAALRFTVFFCWVWGDPLRQPHRLPRSAAATPTAVTRMLPYLLIPIGTSDPIRRPQRRRPSDVVASCLLTFSHSSYHTAATTTAVRH